MTDRDKTIVAWLLAGALLLGVGGWLVGPIICLYHPDAESHVAPLRHEPMGRLEQFGLRLESESESAGVQGFEDPNVKRVYSYDPTHQAALLARIERAAEDQGWAVKHDEFPTAASPDLDLHRDLTSVYYFFDVTGKEVHVEVDGSLLTQQWPES